MTNGPDVLEVEGRSARLGGARLRAASATWARVGLVAVLGATPAFGGAVDPGTSAPTPASGAARRAAPSGAEVVVVEDGARWESAYGERFFQVVGTVTNRSASPVGAVRVRTELLDAEKKVVATFDGWNGRAEALGDRAGGAAARELAALSPDPIAPGGSDRFRATFLEEETPRFESHRVRVVDVLPAP